MAECVQVVPAASRPFLLRDEPVLLVPPNQRRETVLTDAADNKMHHSKQRLGQA